MKTIEESVPIQENRFAWIAQAAVVATVIFGIIVIILAAFVGMIMIGLWLQVSSEFEVMKDSILCR